MNLAHFKIRLELLYFLSLKELKEKYKQAYFGFIWFLIVPLVTLAVFYVIFTYFFSLQIPNYVAYLFSGLIPWFFFSASVSQGINSISANANLVRKVSFPRIFLPLSVILPHLITYLISMLILAFYLIYQHQFNGISFLQLPICIAMTFLLTFNITSTLAYSFVIFRDLRPITELGIFLLFYATPIFYSLDQVPKQYFWILKYNPVCLLIEMHHNYLLNQTSLISYFSPLCIWLIATTVLHFITWKILDPNISDFAV